MQVHMQVCIYEWFVGDETPRNMSDKSGQDFPNVQHRPFSNFNYMSGTQTKMSDRTQKFFVITGA